MNVSRRITVYLFTVLLISQLGAREPETIPYFRQISPNQGLHNTRITDILQDSLGYIWIGSELGLQYYDGYKFRNLNLQHSKDDPSPLNVEILFYHNEFLWISANCNVYCYNTLLGMFVHEWINDEKIHYPVNSFSYDEKNNIIWLTTETQILYINKPYQIDSTELIEMPKKNMYGIDIDNDLMWFVDFDTKKGTYILTKKGIYQIDFISIDSVVLNKKPILAQSNVLETEVKNNVLYVIIKGFIQAYTFHYENNLLKVKMVNKIDVAELNLFNPMPAYRDMITNSTDELWITTSKGLLLIKNPLSKNFTAKKYVYQPNNNYSLNSNLLRNCYIDKNKGMWIGTKSNGISIMNLNQCNFYTVKFENILKEPFKNSALIIIEEDENGYLWLVDRSERIYRFNPTSKELVLRYNLGNRNVVKSIDFINNDLIICGNKEFGKLSTEENTYETFANWSDIYDVPNNGEYHDIVIDKFKTIWISSKKHGVKRIKVQGNETKIIDEVKIYRKPGTRSVISSNFFYDTEKNEIVYGTTIGFERILLDKEGKIEKKINYTGSSAGVQNFSPEVFTIAKECDSVYWIGTSNDGLYRLRVFKDSLNAENIGGFRINNFSTHNGLPVNSIERMVYDGNDYIWILNQNVIKFNINNYKIQTYNRMDGVVNQHVSPFAILKSTQGLIYSGGIDGLNYFNPKEIKDKVKPESIRITGLKLGNHDIVPHIPYDNNVIFTMNPALTKKISLKLVKQDLRIEFSDFSFFNPEQSIFTYKLSGFDKNWKTTTGERPYAEYSYLEPGNYDFMVGHYDKVNEKFIDQKLLQIKINPSWWVYIPPKIKYGIALVIIGLIGIIIYTQWRNIKKELKLKDKMHAMKTQFFTNIYHEIKTPLSLIISPIEDLKNNKLVEYERNALYDLMQSNAHKLHDIVNNLIEYQKAEENIQKFEPEKIDLSQFLLAICQNFQEVLKKRGTNFDINLPNYPIFIQFDKNKLETIVYNLLSNAVKYTPINGFIELSIVEDVKNFSYLNSSNTYALSNAEFNDTNSIGVLVRDSGIGIEQEYLDKIFNRYFTTGINNNSYDLSTGVGLALVKNLVLLCNSQLIVSSQLNVGSEFLIKIPSESLLSGIPKNNIEKSKELKQLVFNKSEEKKENKELLPEELTQLNPANTKILIVEDNDEYRLFLRNRLIKQFTLLEAKNGKIGYDMALKNSPDLIISDVMMPIMNGTEMCQRLKENIDTCHIPIIMLTAKSSENDKVTGAISGADVYIPKPVSYSYLIAEINRLLSARKRLIEKYSKDAFFEAKDMAKTETDKKFIQKLNTIINNNLQAEGSCEEIIVRDLGLSRSNLYKKVKNITDLTLGEYIKSVRLKTAAQLLLTNSNTISETAYMVGIKSPAYFTREFKKHFNKTPTEFVAHYTKNKK